MKQHKWHKEIKAWADGETIEQRHTKRNANYDAWEVVSNPRWIDEICEYRIKPQPKEPQYLYVYCDQKGQQLLRTFLGMNAGETYIGKIKLEVDDEAN